MKTNSRIILLACAALGLALAGAQSVSAWESADCQGCHAEADMVGAELTINPEVYATTLHAEMGCTSCHMASDNHPDGEPVDVIGCTDCHSDAAEEYAGGIHADFAACSDCHDPHSALGATAVSGYAMNQMCAGCHAPGSMAESHAQWLPQAGVHLEAVPCISCHTGSEEIVITWYIADREKPYGDFTLASYEKLAAAAGDRGVPRIIDADGNGNISIAELGTFNTAREYRDLRLVGMMTPEKVSHDFAVLDNRWDCTYCHASGPDAMQTSFLAFPEADGSLRRFDVEPGAALDALYGTPDFYMMGATRNPVLNWIGGAILVGGLMMPLGHGFFRLLTMKNRRH